jgi:hypothetical protein
MSLGCLAVPVCYLTSSNYTSRVPGTDYYDHEAPAYDESRGGEPRAQGAAAAVARLVPSGGARLGLEREGATTFTGASDFGAASGGDPVFPMVALRQSPGAVGGPGHRGLMGSP